MTIATSAALVDRSLNHRYRLGRLVGEGASAWVFASTDLRLERKVAVKVLKPSFAQGDARRRRRFVEEGRTLAGLVHPHVVLVHDAGETDDGIAFLVMELSEAGSLEAELARCGSLPPSQALDLLLPVFGAIECAHDRGIIHRDIKPDNIALVSDKRGSRAKILDFGIAKRCDVDGSSEAVLGTPAYMAPEQVRGEPLTAAADVWSLGVVLFRCLTGRLPFEAETSSALLIKLVQERAPRFAAHCPNLGSHLAVALDHSLEPRAEGRYPDVRSFARALAVACAQDGIPINSRPEPIGLPQFEHWLARADTESTKTLETPRAEPELIAGPKGSTWPRSPRRGRLMWSVLGVGAVLFLLALVPSPGAAPIRVARPVAPPAERTVDLISVSEPAHASATTLAVPVSSVAPRTPLTLPKVTPVRRRRTGAAPPQEKGRTVASETTPSAAAEPPRARLIMTWDW